MNTDKLRELALAADKCGYDSWEHTQFKNEANPTAILELLDALKEIGELPDRWADLVSPPLLIADTCASQLQAILDKLCAS